MSEPLVLMEGIEKRFPGVYALKHVRFELMPGEVHALVGENGAGKSTLMKVLTGVYQKDGGTIFFKGKEVEIPHTRAAQDMGISMIHQELNLMPDLTVAQNIFIGREPRKRLPLFVDEDEMNAKTEQLFEWMNLQVDPRMKVGQLTVAKQQMVEIAKALSFQSEVLIMDEPTAALSEAETNDLFRIIDQLRENGVGMIYISHRMDELKRITDRATIMRDGEYIDTVRTAEVSRDRLIAMMVGRKILHSPKPDVQTKRNKRLLEVRHLHRYPLLQDISFHVDQGEILGFAGLMGAGRTEVARAVFGADPIDSGDIYIHGKKVDIKQPFDAVQKGIGYLSEDRKRYGLMLDKDVKMNIASAHLRHFQQWLGWMDDKHIAAVAEEMISSLNIKTPHADQHVRNLSGGNQQKVVIGKWLVRNCDILIFDEPTRGIDVGTKTEIYHLLHQLAEEGKAIIVISSELPEILRLSHRIMVMCEGRITAELNGPEATQEEIMQYATQRMS